MKKVLYIGIIVVLLIAFGISAFMVVDYLMEGKRQQERFNQLADIKNNPTAAATQPVPEDTKPDPTEATIPTESQPETEPPILPAYQELYEMNSDLVGWIKIEGTRIDYPVMQTEEDESTENIYESQFYIDRDFDKKQSARGCIFADGYADVDEPSDNITIYGHHMKDGSMFTGLMAYEEKKAWEENSLIFFDTLREYHTYQIFAVFATSANVGEGFSYHKFINAGNEAEFDEFVKTCKELAFYDTGITPKYGDKIICLSTCEYTHFPPNGRLVVCAVRIA